MPRPIITRTNKDHWGYYTVGEFKTYSKLEAIELSCRVGTPVSWHYNREVFEQVDWTQEPPGSLEYYYKERALQLREKYDYIVLLYSGGSDSHNALMSFVKNDIFVDEIAQFHQLEAYNGNKEVIANLEQFATSVPITQQLIENNPTYRHTVHRLIDTSAFKQSTLTARDHKWDWWHIHNDFMNLESDCYSNLKTIEPAYKQLSDSGKTVCFIWGFEKPQMDVTWSGEWTFAFCDGAGNSYVNVERKIANEAWDIDEAFYWTPDLPELMIKQAHIIKNFVEKFTPELVDHYHVTNTVVTRNEYGYYPDPDNEPVFTFYKHNQPYTILTNGLRRLIYPYWQPELVVRPKVRSLIFTDADQAYWSGNAPDIGQQHYVKGVVWLRQFMRKHAHDYWAEWKYDPKVTPFNGRFKLLTNSYSLTKRNSK